MCRLLAAVSARPRDLLHEFFDGRYSFMAQSIADPKRKQGDGWGLGHWTGGGWKVIKSSGAVYDEKDAFRKAAKIARGSIVLAHIRNASNPCNVPRSKLINVKNSQPFGSGRYLFIHNGVVTIPREVAAKLGPFRKRIRGINDSEVLFWLFMRNLKREGSIVPAFSRSVEDLWTVWDSLGDAVRAKATKQYGRAAPYYGLNCFISDGKEFHAFCKHDGASKKFALCGGKQPVFQLCYRKGKDSMVVASEMTDRSGGWEFLDDRTVLSVGARKPRDATISDI